MITIGAREAGVNPALLDKVRQGEEVLITRQGKAVARLVATESPARHARSLLSGRPESFSLHQFPRHSKIAIRGIRLRLN